MNHTSSLCSRTGASLVFIVLACAVSSSAGADHGPASDEAADLVTLNDDPSEDGLEAPTDDFTPAPALTTGASTGGLNQGDKNALLDQHNAWRARYNVAPLTWDETVAAVAQEWANQIAASGKFAHRQGSKYGENLWAGTAGAFPMASVVDGWGNEVSNFDIGSNTCAAGKVCGHFMQVIWRKSTKLGCGKATGADGNDAVVCNYDPPGNMLGENPLGR